MQYADENGKIFVGGLSWDTSHASMLKYFSRYGEVIDCVVMKNPATGKSRGFGFVTFKDPSCVETVLSSGPHALDGRQIDPKACNPRSMNKGGKSAENLKKKIFIGGLPANCNEEILKEHFAQYGDVTDVVIMYDQQKQRSRGFGFLTFENDESVERVVQDHYVHINGKQVECKKAEPRDMKAADGTLTLSQLQQSGFFMPGQFAASAMAMNSAAASGLGVAAAGAGIPYSNLAQGAYPTSSQGVRLVQSPISPLVTLLVPGGNSSYHLPPSAYGAWPQPSGPPTAGLAVADGMGGVTGATPYAFSPAQSTAAGGAPVPIGATETIGSSEKAAGYQLLTLNNQLAAGMMGNYPHEASGYGPARGFAVESNGTGASSSANLSFSPNVTYTLAAGMAPFAGASLDARGAYGLSSAPGLAGASLIAGTYGGQGDAPHNYMAAQTSPIGRIAAANHAASAGFHPYRR